ncbi:MAG TPA: ABC transporter ATP-binding protein, partial [Candidatus Goldiibacteriota bacterium]|nr:ABC transporter ATP-binding protein [Candidatus Goldiibacteriota bacterium]
MENIIQVNQLSKRFKETTALDGLTLTVGRGEIFGLIGPDGAGKTTALRILAGLMKPGRGEALVLGRKLPEEAELVKEHAGYMCQKFSLYTDLSIDENIRFFADLYGISSAELDKRLEPLLAMTRLAPFRDRLAGRLSGGMKQKLALICTLIHRPEVLFLDEPTTGVDPLSRREFWEILQQIHAEGVTIVVTTPYMDEAEQCSRIGLMFKGKIIAMDTPRNLKKGLQKPVIEAHPKYPGKFAAAVASCAGISDWQQLGDRFHIVADNEQAVSAVMAIQDAGARRIAANIEDVF